uniref:DNA replication complex GINS protein PSF1 C-terminal domain-containing protein n=1 Tax=Pseudo-nitzschia arenysensis TaxID=697910 RepID=A0A7R9ZU59_9STRA|mmetsp:Transcript_620/g.1474  ORF Transcript_620/g.1474 Transcript_620/m.1474 type:complete len:239 (+) Transcript_620:100-816(+)|eukprot:CAMPEP_0116143948 /NCGR_PEP_ID=MMETSP0329-20121206/15723_1 /TAXON_ID=697910 /ORGANISM="Pseudo-nitzschia arenysensis, Strain B593" /LENGTH=238 /DNA_ID=CAMNT_0003639303 /DNA_START=28 /DNA_END=744 /DNA_ORIENTATION=-
MAVATSSQGNSNSVPLVPNSGRELLLDLKRSTARNALGGGNSKNSIPTLPAYNHKLVQACFRDLHGTARELELKARVYGNNNDDGSSKPSMSARPSILLHNIAVQRNKRCLLAYHHHRVEIIKSIQRAKGLENNNMNDDYAVSNAPISTNAQEVAFARDYATLREAYSSKVFELDLLPPTSHMLQVRVLREVGQVVLPDSGKVVTMTKGACLFLDRADAKDFLKQGVLQLYDGEEVDF